MVGKVSVVVLLLAILFLVIPILDIVLASSSIGWSKTFGGVGFDSSEALIQSSDGGYALVGMAESYGLDSYALWFIKTDGSGNMEWDKTYGIGSAMAVVQTSDGGFVIGGSKLVRTDSEGNVEWEKNYEANSMVQTTDGGYALVRGEFWLSKTDALGNLQWERNHDGPELESAQCVIQTSDGGYAITGWTRPGSGEGDFLLIKTDPSGELEWSKTYGSIDKDEGHVVVQTSDRGYILAGLMWNRSGSGSAGVIKTDSAGNVEWTRNYQSGSVWDIALTNDGGYIIACDRLVKIDSDGNIQWTQPYGNARSVIQTNDGGYALTGTSLIFDDDGSVGSYAWLIKLDVEGNIPEFTSGLIVPLLIMVILVIFISKKRFIKLIA